MEIRCLFDSKKAKEAKTWISAIAINGVFCITKIKLRSQDTAGINSPSMIFSTMPGEMFSQGIGDSSSWLLTMMVCEGFQESNRIEGMDKDGGGVLVTEK